MSKATRKTTPKRPVAAIAREWRRTVDATAKARVRLHTASKRVEAGMKAAGFDRNKASDYYAAPKWKGRYEALRKKHERNAEYDAMCAGVRRLRELSREFAKQPSRSAQDAAIKLRAMHLAWTRLETGDWDPAAEGINMLGDCVADLRRLARGARS